MLYNKLTDYYSSGIYPMHMPGHKRTVDSTAKRLPYDIDITEINGFDNLQYPDGILLETSELAASLYRSEKAFLLVGGSSVGILAAIGAHVSRGEKILVSRNSHISVYNAIALFGLYPVYLAPVTDDKTGIALGVAPATVCSALENDPDISLVVLTSPTYEGFISDIAAIADIVHKRGIPLMVDSAHGAHLGFSSGFPAGAISAGADIVVMSLHKTLPALTQCALLHLNSGRCGTQEVERLLSVFQTTSPSYVLLSSIDHCLHILTSEREALFEKYKNKLSHFDNNINCLSNIFVLGHNTDFAAAGVFDFDPGKLVVVTKNTNLNGTMLADILRNKYRIETEAAFPRYLLAMTSICDSGDGLTRFASALCEIDKSISDGKEVQVTISKIPVPPISPMRMLPGDALSAGGHLIPIESAQNSTSLEYIWAYPPGVPLITPGELITVELISYLNYLSHEGVILRSTRNALPLITVLQ